MCVGCLIRSHFGVYLFFLISNSLPSPSLAALFSLSPSLSLCTWLQWTLVGGIAGLLIFRSLFLTGAVGSEACSYRRERPVQRMVRRRRDVTVVASTGKEEAANQ